VLIDFIFMLSIAQLLSIFILGY